MGRTWSLVAVGCGLVGCGMPDGDYFGSIPDHIDTTHFRWCNQGEPDHLDPVLASSTVSAPLNSALFDGLTTYGMDGLPTASLATAWEASADLRTFTFHLRHDARWSNGRPLTAYDVAYSAIRGVQAVTASPNADNLAPIKNATASLAGTVFVLRHELAPYHAGDVVELVGPAVGELDVRAGTRPLALRELGAPASAAYATVPAESHVTLIMTTGGRATLPSPDGVAWAYVYWSRGADDVMGWVPASELDDQPGGERSVKVRAVAAKDQPDGATHEQIVVDAHARDLERSADVLGIRVPDPYTFVFETADPTPYYLAMTDNRVFRPTPIEAVSRSPRHWDRPGRIVTSGPFDLEAWAERDRVELVRSTTYWDRASVKLERITAFSVDDQAATTNLYFTGACDATAANNIPSTYLPALDGEQRGRPYKDYDVSPILSVYFAWVNTEKLPDRHLRRALAYAIDRTQVPRFLHGNELPTAQLTPGTPIAKLSDVDLAACHVTRETPGVALVMIEGVLCYVPPPGLDYDVAAAKRELALARAEGGVPDHVLEYRYNAGSEGHKQIAEYLQSAWAAIGLEVRITAQEWNSLLDDTRKGNFEIVRFGSQGNAADTESEFLPLFRCGSPDNRGKYCSPRFEQLMTEASPLRDREARNAKLREAESVMIEDAPVLPIYVYTQKHLIKPYVRDYGINLIDQPPLWRVWLEPR